MLPPRTARVYKVLSMTLVTIRSSYEATRYTAKDKLELLLDSVHFVIANPLMRRSRIGSLQLTRIAGQQDPPLRFSSGTQAKSPLTELISARSSATLGIDFGSGLAAPERLKIRIGSLSAMGFELLRVPRVPAECYVKFKVPAMWPPSGNQGT